MVLAILGKFDDNKVLTAITFGIKYYLEDNQFTSRSSLSLANRLKFVRITTFSAKNQYSKISVIASDC
ncbi:unnamed protein product [Rotaria sordida]|uniref:Uncharacterized protein n=1 Tax=Rotaria sordida TaxID=392033 RepID=A0A818GH36_9BILA|nr:unnamed protein product [Rotaria sordida]